MKTHLPPAHLFIGSPTITLHEITEHMQRIFCPHQGCFVCATCMRVAQHQHHNLLWIEPEKNYTLEDLEPIRHCIQFTADDAAPFFIVLIGADTLTAACANSLLKSLEEPPAGYHFLLSAQRKDLILPTIISRCTITYCNPNDIPEPESPIARCLKKESCDILGFMECLDANQINEQESVSLLHTLLEYYAAERKEIIDDENARIIIEQRLQTIQKALEYPPMPGSTKIFWRNLFLRMR